MANQRNLGGRPAGVPNKRSMQLQVYVDQEGGGVSPAKVLLAKMWHHYNLAAAAMKLSGAARNEGTISKHLDNAAEAAKEAAPYIHARLSAVTVSGDEDNPLQHQHSVTPAITAEQLKAMTTNELAGFFRETVGAPDPDQGEPGNAGAGGNGALPA